MPQSEKVPTLRQQASHARTDLVLRGVHLGVPWAVLVGVTVFGVFLRTVMTHVDHGHWLWLTVMFVLACGGVITALDAHLRSGRRSLVARVIGPFTTAAGTIATALFLLLGTPAPLVLAWMFGGVTACAGWDLWLAHAPRHDLDEIFGRAAARAGLGETRLTPAARPRVPLRTRLSGPARRAAAVLTGTIALDRGEVTADDLAARVANLEGAQGYPPGAYSLSPNADKASHVNFTVSDPRVLDVSPQWPGPSAPGADMSVPFRLGMRQDGKPFTYSVLPLHHMRASGGTGSGKTMSWLWNFYAEAVTRQDFAGFGFDIVKRRQFMGPLEPALHGLAVEPEECLEQFLALRRARKARLDYLTKLGKTEWDPGCGLSFLGSWMEELASILEVLAELSKHKAGIEPFTVKNWVEGCRADRSAGIRHDASMQFGKETQFPTEARGQFGALCFGTADKNESRIGLSAVQSDANCRPELWGKRYPGKAYADPGTSATTEADVTIPVRFYDWGRDAARITAYMAEWPASARPLDDVTAEAMANKPPLQDSYYPPVPAVPGYPAQGLAAPRRADPRDAARPVVARRLFRSPPPGQRNEAERVRAEATELLGQWLADGKGTFVVADVQDSGVLERIGRSRPWVYEFAKILERIGLAEQVPGARPKRWRILPAVQSGAA